MRAIRHCLNKQLLNVCQRSIELEALSEKVSQFLPEALAKACRVGHFSKGSLILTTTDACFASQLRYVLPELRDKLRTAGGLYQLISIKVNLVETSAFVEDARKKQTSLSLKARACLLEESQRFTYQALKDVFLKLAKS